MATTSGWHATKRNPRITPYAPVSFDPGFEEIVFVSYSSGNPRYRPPTDSTQAYKLKFNSTAMILKSDVLW